MHLNLDTSLNLLPSVLWRNLLFKCVKHEKSLPGTYNLECGQCVDCEFHFASRCKFKRMKIHAFEIMPCTKIHEIGTKQYYPVYPSEFKCTPILNVWLPLQLVCPGSWLCDLTLERYEVREKKVSKKVLFVSPWSYFLHLKSKEDNLNRLEVMIISSHITSWPTV